MKKNTLILLCAAFLGLSPLYAERIVFQADSMTGNTGKKNEYTKLSGSASVVTETMEISADTIELSGKDFRNIKAIGNVHGVNKESKMDFTCGEMYFDRETKLATLQSAVHLDDLENEVTAEAELIEYNQKTEIAIMQISVVLKQKENTCTAAYAIYRKKDGLLSMSGNPKVQQGKDAFRAQEIELNLNTQEITLDGRVRGSVTSDGKGSDSSPAQAAPAPKSPADTSVPPQPPLPGTQSSGSSQNTQALQNTQSSANATQSQTQAQAAQNTQSAQTTKSQEADKTKGDAQ